MTAIAAPPRPRTLADLLSALGEIPASRVLAQPPPGTATERDLLAQNARGERPVELVEGVLVEKAMGFLEAFLASRLVLRLGAFVEARDLGVVVGDAATIRLVAGLVRIPDALFLSWDRLPGRTIPAEPIPDLVPDLVVEVLSRSNTPAEMDRKLAEYFRAGVRLAWYVDPAAREVRVYTAPDAMARLGELDTLDGSDVLPGFALPLRELFAPAGRPGAAGAD